MSSETKERRCSLPPLVCKLQTRPMVRKKSQGLGSIDNRNRRNSGTGQMFNKVATRRDSEAGTSMTGETWRNSSRNTGMAFASSALQRRVSNTSYSGISVDEEGKVPSSMRRVSGAPSIRGTGVSLAGRRKKNSLVEEPHELLENPADSTAAVAGFHPIRPVLNKHLSGQSANIRASHEAQPRRRISQIDQISTGSSDMQRRISNLEKAMDPNNTGDNEPEAFQGWMSRPQSIISSIEGQTPEPGYAIQYGRNLERFKQDQHPEYKPKRCWCTRCQMMFRLHMEGNTAALSSWGSYPCHQF